jgi:hypothetical protein
LEHFKKNWYLCLKSPEISHVLPQLADCFPETKFVLVYRPIIETAESMYRIGNLVKIFPVFHSRWKQEIKETGELIPPPGIPEEWFELWNSVSDFQRCILNTASYIRSLIEGLKKLSWKRFFLYNHNDLSPNPEKIFSDLAAFLGVAAEGFSPALKNIRVNNTDTPETLKKEFRQLEKKLNIIKLYEKLVSLNTLKSGNGKMRIYQ